MLFSGQYWIDPNGGDINDAIMVYCDMPTSASCVYPKPMMSEDLTHTDRNDAWLSEIENGFTVIFYNIQLTKHYHLTF